MYSPSILRSVVEMHGESVRPSAVAKDRLVSRCAISSRAGEVTRIMTARRHSEPLVLIVLVLYCGSNELRRYCDTAPHADLLRQGSDRYAPVERSRSITCWFKRS